MAHLKKSATTGHLLKTANGHFSISCGGVPQYGIAPIILPDVDGNPALYYFTGAPYYASNWSFIRASNAAGTAWNSPILIGLSLSGDENCFCGTQLGSSSGVTNPNRPISIGAVGADIETSIADDDAATSFTKNEVVTAPTSNIVRGVVRTDNDLIGFVLGGYNWYLSDDVDATSFTFQDTIPTTGGGNNPTMTRIVAGRPTFISGSYESAGGSGNVGYIRADDADGTTWNGTLSPTFPSVETIFDYCDCNGRPGVVYRKGISSNADRLFFVIGDDADATGWSTPIEVPTYPMYATPADYGADTRPAGGAIAYDASAGRIYIRWSIFGSVVIYGDTPVPTSYGYYSYYPVIGLKLCIYESYSDDNGATWSTPTQAYSVNIASDTGQTLQAIDFLIDGSGNKHTAWHRSDTYEIYYNGNVVTT